MSQCSPEVTRLWVSKAMVELKYFPLLSLNGFSMILLFIGTKVFF